jgi:hypothetical protein
MVIYLVIIMIIMISNYTSYKNGNEFYILRKNPDNKIKIFDLSYKYLPKLIIDDRYINILNWVFTIFPFFPFIFFNIENKFKLFIEIIEYFVPVMLIRTITINLTILPPNKKCNLKQFTYNEYLQGHSYDKLFSGHLSLALIAMYIFWIHNIVSFNYIVVNIFLIIFYMLLFRLHYSNDLIFSFFVVYFIINENIKLSY